jgi:hypothetical protein
MEHWICGRAEKEVIVKQHLAANLQEVDARHAALKVQASEELVHPLQSQAAPFVGNEQGRTYSLTCGKDFLSRKGARRSVGGWKK